MTSLDDDLVPAVLELVDELGAAATYVSIQTEYDPATTDVAVARQNFTIKMTPPQAAKEFAEGETFGVRDLETIIAASGLEFTPKLGDKVTFQGTTYAVVGVPPIYSGDSICAYTLRLRR